LSNIDTEELRESIDGMFYPMRKMIESHFVEDSDYLQYNELEIDWEKQLEINHQYVLKVKQMSSGMVDYPKQFETSASLIWPEVAMPYSMSLVIKCGVGFTLCMKTVENLGTEKHLKYVQGLKTMSEIGCFALTELGHGSNVQGI
jgi:acyl-CoA oxidase